MSFLRYGIENVRACFLPDAIAADGRPDIVSGAAVITWNSSCPGMLHQVYLNGQFAGTTVDAGQKSVVVRLSGSSLSAVRLEVIAVEPEYACVDFADHLDLPAPICGRIRLILLRSQTLPFGATVNVYSDGGSGQIYYDEPMNSSPIPVWTCPDDKAGFGMARFGEADLGYDAAASIGLGRGSFGNGQFGLDADTIEWMSPPLPLGTYRLSVKTTNSRGNESAANEIEPITVIPAATPAAALEVVTFNPATNELTLSIHDQQ